jgi:hypothetical protein
MPGAGRVYTRIARRSNPVRAARLIINPVFCADNGNDEENEEDEEEEPTKEEEEEEEPLWVYSRSCPSTSQANAVSMKIWSRHASVGSGSLPRPGYEIRDDAMRLPDAAFGMLSSKILETEEHPDGRRAL